VTTYAGLSRATFEMYETRLAVTLIGFAERSDGFVDTLHRTWPEQNVRGLSSVSFIRYAAFLRPEVVATGQDKLVVALPAAEEDGWAPFLAKDGLEAVACLMAQLDQRRVAPKSAPKAATTTPVWLLVGDAFGHSVCAREDFVISMGTVNCRDERISYIRFAPVTEGPNKNKLLVVFNVALALVADTDVAPPPAKKMRSYSSDSLVLPPPPEETSLPLPGRPIWKAQALQMFIPRVKQREVFKLAVERDGVEIFFAVTPARHLDGREVFVCATFLISFSRGSGVMRAISPQ
jgi:hypothetical protein